MRTVNYQTDMGNVTYPEGFCELVKGLSVEEQLKYFRTTEKSSYIKTGWSERTIEGTRKLEDDSHVRALIVRDGYIVGAMIEEWFSKKESPVLPDKCVCTYFASDNDGSGYNECEEYTYFVCVPECN